MVSINVKLNHILLAVYVVLLSVLLKKILYLPLLFALALVIFDRYIPENVKNLLYVAVALVPFPSMLAIFLFYIPFAVYGLAFENSNFIKRYLFGYSLSIFSAAFVYIFSILTDIRISLAFLIFAYYLPVAAIAFKVLRKDKSRLLSAFRIEAKELAVLIVSLLFLFFVAGQIINSENMYASNGTYLYTKFFSVLNGIKKFNEVPQYDPMIGMGEQLFLTDTPAFFSNFASINILLSWISPVLFFNSITAFVLWLSILGAWLLIYELINKKEDYVSYIIAVVGAMSIVLSFTILQLFESFKMSSTFPLGFLALSMVFSFGRPVELLSIISVLSAAFIIHPTKSTGIILIAGFSFILAVFSSNPKEKILGAFAYCKKNKLILISVALIFILLPLFYLFPGYYYKSYAREGHFPKLSELHPSYYIKDFLFNKDTNPLSVKYPDLRRIDEKKFGFFFTFFGIASMIFTLVNFKKSNYRKAAIFSAAYLLHFIVSAFINNIPPFAQAEYGYRTALPFLLVVLAACISAVFASFNNRLLRISLLIVFFGAFLHASYYAKENLKFIHSESVIAGETFSSEINFIKQLPTDGRFISYGFYSNAIDMAFAALTEHPFSRYGYLQWDFTDNLYDKLKTMNSFGTVEVLNQFSGAELSNYLRLGGFKYVFLNICHPVGDLAAKKLYPRYSSAIYQNPNAQCFVMLSVNSTNYAEKVHVLENVNESEYNEENGYWHVTFNRNRKIHNFNLEPYMNDIKGKPDKPTPLKFNRISPTKVEINGDFKNGDWVVFKEEYFPRWKAYMDGKEIPLLATNYRMMLMRANEGNKITLVYEMQRAEKIATFMSLPAVLGLIIIFVLAV